MKINFCKNDGTNEFWSFAKQGPRQVSNGIINDVYAAIDWYERDCSIHDLFRKIGVHNMPSRV